MHDEGSGSAIERMALQSNTARQRALLIAFVINASYFTIELVGGLVFHSLALLADAAHMFSDVVGLLIAIVAQRFIARPPSDRHSFGWLRAEVLGGHLNGLLLIAVSVWIVISATSRLSQSPAVEGGGMFVVGVIGLAVNIVSAIVLARSAGDSLNMRGAYLHMLADAVSSVGAVVAAVAVIVWNANWADAAASIFIALLVAWASLDLVRNTTDVMLEATPRGLKTSEVVAALCGVPQVDTVHHVHAWSLASDVRAFSCHVVLRNVASLHDAEQVVSGIKHLLRERFDIAHSTIETECHECET